MVFALSACAALFIGRISGEQFMTALLIIFSFYYKEKKDAEVEKAIADASKG